MWKPNYVIAEHKKRASLVWAGLLLTIVGFVVWQIVSLVDKYNNPSTTFEVSDEIFRFPTMEVCFWGYHGCDWNVSSCIESVNATITDTCEEVWDVRVDSPPESKDCVTFDLGRVETEGFAARCNESVRPSIDLKMIWHTSDETGGEDSFSSRVSVYLGGVDVQEVTWVPYSRVVYSEEDSGSEIRIAETHMTIGKSTRTYLSSSPVVSYPTLKISSTDYIYRNQATFLSESTLSSSFLSDSTSIGGGEPSVGYLFLNVNLGRFSLTKLSDDNPIDMLDFIANIGGFWEVLLLVWGVFFIATLDTTPEQKARNFDKHIKKGKRSMRVKGSVGGEEQPNWNIAHGGPLQDTGSSNGGTVSAN